MKSTPHIFLYLALITFITGCSDPKVPVDKPEQTLSEISEPLQPLTQEKAPVVKTTSISEEQRQTLDKLAATAVKRGGTPPVIFDYSHGITRSGDVATLRSLVEAARPGDVVTVPVGVYENTGIIQIKASGTAAAPITLRAETPGQAVFTGESAFEVTGDYWTIEGLLFDNAVYSGKQYTHIFSVNGADGVRLTNCAFISCGAPDVDYVSVVSWREGANNGWVDHCSFVNSLSMTLQVRVGPNDADTAKGMRIEHNYFRDIRRWHKNGGECIQIGSNPMKYGRLKAEAIVEFNRFERADGDSEVISNKSSANRFHGNTFIGCGGGLWLRGGEDCIVSNNQWFGGSSGIIAYGNKHTISGNIIEGTHSYALLIQYGSDWQNVENAGYSFEALSNSMIHGNAIINPRVRGLVYGAFRNQERMNIPPHDNVISNNIIIGEQGTLLIAEDFGETRIAVNLVHAQASAKVGNPIQGFQKVSFEEARRAMPNVQEMMPDAVGAKWLPVHP